MHRTRVRAIKVVIDIPSTDATPWVVMPIQKVVVDETGKVVQTIDRTDQVYRNIANVAFETVTALDPITGQVNTVSILGLGQLITAAAAKFMAEDFNGTIDNELLVWIDE